ncbi:MAG: DNA mismatch repair protein MutS, partial [Clostridia bacterium]|nr:DNA mismatch repair protein MutS [Clostridia bacterium]
EYKSKIPGSVIDRSASGSTVFIEPETIARMQDEIEGLRIEEDCEERRILYTLMDKIAMEEDGFKENLELLVKLDFVFAKGKLSAQMEAGEPAINTRGVIRLKGARHPLLPGDANVPLDFELGGEKRGMVITGPNTGGKTVAIKTVGLFVLMACSGLHLPCMEADIAMRNLVLCDIGDGQDILDNLSTFSAHITNVLEILKRATGESLVILDELGSGTDPAEGMGIAIAILEQLRLRGCLYLVTTHYPEVKTYAGRHKELISARMAFDRENLRPLYRLEMGKTGDSCALYIAKRLGMPEDMIQTAAAEAYGEGAKLEKPLEKTREKPLEKSHEKTPVKSPGRHWPGGLERIPVPGIVPIKRKPAAASPEDGYTRGDSVEVLPKGEIGIVVRPADQTGNVLVQVKREKRLVNQKRLKLKVRAKELYPEDYDFSIVFDSVENRKARHQMERKYVGNMEVRAEE